MFLYNEGQKTVPRKLDPWNWSIAFHCAQKSGSLLHNELIVRGLSFFYNTKFIKLYVT